MLSNGVRLWPTLSRVSTGLDAVISSSSNRFSGSLSSRARDDVCMPDVEPEVVAVPEFDVAVFSVDVPL
jgi:hypothetical protein